MRTASQHVVRVCGSGALFWRRKPSPSFGGQPRRVSEPMRKLINELVVDVIREKMDQLKMGRNVLEEGHSVILGWTDRAPLIIEEIILANESEGGGQIVRVAAALSAARRAHSVFQSRSAQKSCAIHRISHRTYSQCDAFFLFSPYGPAAIFAPVKATPSATRRRWRRWWRLEASFRGLNYMPDRGFKI